MLEPELCPKTGRLLTEWFEYPEYSKEELERIACEHYGIPYEEMPKLNIRDAEARERDPVSASLARHIQAFVRARLSKPFPCSMPPREVHYRLNEASKMVDPSNYKFLPEHITERTGLEINPLWMIECLVRSGLLSPKEQIAALKELAQYTHSKAPSISHSTTTAMTPEDWLNELAKDDYEVIEAKVVQPLQKREYGAGASKDAVTRREREHLVELVHVAEDEAKAIEAEAMKYLEDMDDIDLDESI